MNDQSTSSPRSVRSFADLGDLFGRPRPPARRVPEDERPADKPLNSRQRRNALYAARLAAREQVTPNRSYSPVIPCSQCSRGLPYELAVPREFSPDAFGYCHPVGECDRSDIKRWEEKRATFASFYEGAVR